MFLDFTGKANLVFNRGKALHGDNWEIKHNLCWAFISDSNWNKRILLLGIQLE